MQVSPPAEHIQGTQWWTSYQPVSYRIAGRLGDRTAFRNMVDTCHAAGVKVVVDTVVNHMSAGSGTGTGGSSYTKYDYPGLYSSADFDDCTAQVTDYQDRWNVQHCELVGLADLDTGEEYVRKTIAGYMNDLLTLGVDGFRVDAAKHIPAADLADIKSRLTNPSAYWKQEVIYGAGEAVQPPSTRATATSRNSATPTTSTGVHQREAGLPRQLRRGLGLLEQLGRRSLRGQPRHRAQRLDPELQERRELHAGERLHAGLALRAPDVNSGYEWSDADAGPPNGGQVNACWQDGWKCQHAWPEIKSMVAFRNATRTQAAVTKWWDNGGNLIAFGRGSKGYVVINHESTAADRWYETSLPAGTYCDVQGNRTVTVDGSGWFQASVAPNTALALYAGKSSC